MRMATGFIRASDAAYRGAAAYGLSKMLRERYPGVCDAVVSPQILPSIAMGSNDILPRGLPGLQRASPSTGDVTSLSPNDTGSSPMRDEKSESASSSAIDNLDTLT